MHNPNGKRKSAFGAPSHADVTPGLNYVIADEGDPIVADEIPVMDIWPDILQPRRSVPPIVRAGFDGNPASIPPMLGRYNDLASERAGQHIDAKRYILADTTAPEIDRSDPLVERYMKLLDLAADIYDVGLTNYPTVTQEGDDYRLETGERRLLAHHLLMIHVDADAHSMIHVKVKDVHSVWAQASENNNRDGLSAIEKARQIAVLLMDMWRDEREFDDYWSMVTPEGSDRPYYAQAYTLSSRDNMGDRLTQAMGVKSRGSVSKYKSLLMLSDKDWLAGEENGTPLKELRKLVPKDDDEQAIVSSGNNTDEDGETPDSDDNPKRIVSSGNNTAPSTEEMHNATNVDAGDDGPIETGPGATVARDTVQHSTTQQTALSQKTTPKQTTVQAQSVDPSIQRHVDVLKAMLVISEYCRGGQHRAQAITAIDRLLSDVGNTEPNKSEVWHIYQHLKEDAMDTALTELFGKKFEEFRKDRWR